jgi:hypothetical protein
MAISKGKAPIFDEHIEDLYKSGLTDETIHKAGLYSRKALGYLENKGVESLLVFPYKNCKASAFNRMKLFPPIKDKKGKTQKYHVSKDSKNHLYITDSAFDIRDLSDKPLYITEGEKKSLALHQHGFPCIGISGLWNWKNKGRERLIGDFNLFNFKNRTAYLIPDNDFNDKKHNGGLVCAVNKLADKLTELGAKVYVIKLPEGKAKGIDDYLKAFSPKKFLELKEKTSRLIGRTKGIIKKPSCHINDEDLQEYCETGKPIQYLDTKGMFYFSLKLASELGIPEAIILQKIHNWLGYNYERNRHSMTKDDRIWTYRGYTSLQRELRIFSKQTIIRAIKELEKRKILIVGNYNKRLGDRTKWYSIDYVKIKEYLEV